jgi:hypothetical protein
VSSRDRIEAGWTADGAAALRVATFDIALRQASTLLSKKLWKAGASMEPKTKVVQTCMQPVEHSREGGRGQCRPFVRRENG